jgi:hypothetical protein
MKKILFSILFFIGFLSLTPLETKADEVCTVEGVNFQPSGIVDGFLLADRRLTLTINTKDCIGKELRIEMWTMDPELGNTNEEVESARIIGNVGNDGIVRISYKAGNEDCDASDNKCRYGVIIKNSLGVSLYNSGNGAITSVTKNKIEYGCEGSCDSGNLKDWTATSNLKGPNGEEFIPQKPPVDASSPCYDPKTDSYTETCYEFLAPLPGFESTQSDGKTSNIKTNTDGRTSIIDVRQFKIGDFVNSMFQISLGILMVLCVVMIIMDGVSYMMSEVPFVKSMAKGRIGNALMGLLLALSIYTILWTINPKLLEVNFGDGIETVSIEVRNRLTDPDFVKTFSNVDISKIVIPRGAFGNAGFLAYLTHQQGAGGASAILRAAQQGKSLSSLPENIQKNMRNNYLGPQPMTPQSFLEDWYKRFEAKKQQVNSIPDYIGKAIDQAAAEVGIDKNDLRAMCMIESYNCTKPGVVNSGGYSGLFQLSRQVFEKYKKPGSTNILDPYQNAYAAARYAKDNLKRF